MIDKETQIVEMANDLAENLRLCAGVKLLGHQVETIAYELLKKYQPKLPKDSVAITKEEWEEYQKFKSFMKRNDWESVDHIETTLDKCQEVLYERLQQASKETAKKIKDFILFLKLSEEADSLARLILGEVYWQVDGFIKNNLGLE